MQVRREGPFIHLAALRRDGSLGASLSFRAKNGPALLEAISYVIDVG